MKILKNSYIIIVVILIIFSILFIGLNISKYRKSKSMVIYKKKIIDEQIPIKEDIPTIDFDKLKKMYHNNDIKGAIRIKNEDFEKIIFQTDNNTYYLNHNYMKKKGTGEIFIDSNLSINSSTIKVLNIKGTDYNKVFKKYYDEQYYVNHKIIELETEKLIYKYEIQLIYSGSLNYKNIDYNDLLNNSLYNYNSNITQEDELIIINCMIDNKEISIIGKKVK